VFIDGKKSVTLRGANVAAEFKQMVIDYIERALARATRGAPRRSSGALGRKHRAPIFFRQR